MKYNGREFKSIHCCKDCAERYLACHDHCQKYQDALTEWKEKKAFIRKAKKNYRAFDAFLIENFSKKRS